MNTSLLLRAAMLHYEAKQAKALADLDVYLNRPVGVGEHATITEEVIKLFAELDAAESVSKTIQTILAENEKMNAQAQAQPLPGANPNPER